MNFKEFTTILKEARFRETPAAALLKQIKKTAQLYYTQYNSINADISKLISNKKIVSFKENKEYKQYFEHFKITPPTYFTPLEKPLGKVKVVDLETGEEKQITILCIYGQVGNEYAAYSENFETVNVYDSSIKNLSLRMVESKILHEITHGFQQYKSYSSKYLAALENGTRKEEDELYYKEPIEYDTHLNEVIYNIREKHQELIDGIKTAKEPAAKKILENRLNLFFQQIVTLIIAPPEDYFKFKALTLPSYVAEFEDFLKDVKDEPRLWSKFKLKLTNFYQELTGKDVRGNPVK